MVGKIEVELVAGRRRHNRLPRRFHEVLEQVFNELAQDVAVDLVGRDLLIEAFQGLERIALDRWPGRRGPALVRISAPRRSDD